MDTSWGLLIPQGKLDANEMSQEQNIKSEESGQWEEERRQEKSM